MKRNKLTLIMLILALAGVGCSSKKEHDSAATGTVDETILLPSPTTPLPTPGGTGETPNVDSNSVTFVPTSFSVFNTYVAVRPLNNPSDFRLTVDLRADSTGRSYGTVRIGYNDNGQRYEGVFDSGSGDNPYLKYADGNGKKEYHYNYWFKHEGKTVFNGYFQDAYGSIVLVVDSVVNQGDGQGGSFVSGSVYFMNFPYLQVQQGPMRKCWFITDGPYNCRTAALNHKNAIYPGIILDRSPAVYYHKLGTFSGLSLSKAFK